MYFVSQLLPLSFSFLFLFHCTNVYTVPPWIDSGTLNQCPKSNLNWTQVGSSSSEPKTLNPQRGFGPLGDDREVKNCKLPHLLSNKERPRRDNGNTIITIKYAVTIVDEQQNRLKIYGKLTLPLLVYLLSLDTTYSHCGDGIRVGGSRSSQW